MFNSNKGRGDDRPPMPPAPPEQAPSSHGRGRGVFSVLGADVVITGNISASADLHIDGRVEGDVNCGSLAQGAESQIYGNVTADSARLAGAVEGAVRVRQLTVERTAKITGDVEYENITIENGGNIDGRLKHMANIDATAQTGPRAVPSSPFGGANNQAA